MAWIAQGTVPPYQPESNGLAENAVRTCETLLNKAKLYQCPFDDALFAWRATRVKQHWAWLVLEWVTPYPSAARCCSRASVWLGGIGLYNDKKIV